MLGGILESRLGEVEELRSKPGTSLTIDVVGRNGEPAAGATVERVVIDAVDVF